MSAEGREQGEDRAYDLALRALSRKERTVREMSEWLRERGVEQEAVEAVSRRLSELGALDDRDYARRFAEDRRELSGWGRRRIAEDLRRRGVEEEILEAALAEEHPEEELERAVLLLDKRGIPLHDDRECGRALGYLARRGFEMETAYAAIRRQAA